MLIALAWPNHVHHARAVRWFTAVRQEGWATCPVTETGFVRVSSNVRVIPQAQTPEQAIVLLREMRQLPGHIFWVDEVSVVDSESLPFTGVVGYRQITHAHLLTLAMRRGGRVSTFDRGVSDLVPDSRGAVEVIP